MGIIAANLFLTLDGVYQAPGGTQEDTSGGFEFGGWQAPFDDAASGEAIGAELDRIDALLLGRRTYDIFADYWPRAEGEIAELFARVPKYVVSTTLGEPSWAGTTVLRDTAAVGRLREQYDEVHVIGSGDLVQSLLAEDLVHRLTLWLYPVALGSGKRLFEHGRTIPSTFRFARPVRAFDGGAVSLVYERAGGVETWDMDDELG